ncbi:16S rRNA (adenine(1518)-N(6)/adenine(1519)-N(6))-dimethyltransferase RsmA, partial [Xylanibacter rarus]
MRTVRPKKNLGQHFLTDLNIANAIADTVDACPDIPILEVGPGMGVLTQYLVQKNRDVKVVEIDSESVNYLNEKYPDLRENIIEDDFLKMDLNTVFNGRKFVLTGNYPYDISSQIFFKMLDNKDLIPCCTGMIQREVAQRMASEPGTKAYGILSVLIQAWYDVEYLFTVDENVFNPPPKV